MNQPYARGQAVRLDYNGQSVQATVLLAASNGRSLMLTFAGALHTPAGGMLIGSIPLLREDDGIYRDLAEGAPATLAPWSATP